MRILSILTALFFLVGCGAFQLTAAPEPGPPEPTRVAPPAAGKRVEVDVKPRQTVCLDIPDLKDARVVVRDDGLLIVLPNGGEIFLANFRPDPESGLPAALCLADQTVALVLEGGLGGIAPGAGPGAPDGPLDSDQKDGGGDTGGGNGGGNPGGDTESSHDDNHSGLGDGTNPGYGDGTGNSPNEGTDNPNNAGMDDDDGSHDSHDGDDGHGGGGGKK